MTNNASELRQSVDLMRSVAKTALREIRKTSDSARVRRLALLGFAEIEAEAQRLESREVSRPPGAKESGRQSTEESVKLAFSGI